MTTNTKIEWTDFTWNPVRGCIKISPGCAHCYAETFAERFRGVPNHPYEFGFDPRLVPSKLADPVKLAQPSRIFVNSMSDLFLDQIPDDYVVLVTQIMFAANWHSYQVLTKRSERMRELLQTKLAFAAQSSHIWWGVSVENKRHGLPRIRDLQAAAPAMTFLSVEPLLEDIGSVDLRGIRWVIVGGESGHGARPMARDWVRSIRDQCGTAHIPFFFKQWGGVHKSKTGRELDGRTYDDYPAVSGHPVMEKYLRQAIIADIERRSVGMRLRSAEETLQLFSV